MTPSRARWGECGAGCDGVTVQIVILYSTFESSLS